MQVSIGATTKKNTRINLFHFTKRSNFHRLSVTIEGLTKIPLRNLKYGDLACVNDAA